MFKHFIRSNNIKSMSKITQLAYYMDEPTTIDPIGGDESTYYKSFAEALAQYVDTTPRAMGGNSTPITVFLNDDDFLYLSDEDEINMLQAKKPGPFNETLSSEESSDESEEEPDEADPGLGFFMEESAPEDLYIDQNIYLEE